jgi:hypothetical protein
MLSQLRLSLSFIRERLETVPPECVNTRRAAERRSGKTPLDHTRGA